MLGRARISLAMVLFAACASRGGDGRPTVPSLEPAGDDALPTIPDASAVDADATPPARLRDDVVPRAYRLTLELDPTQAGYRGTIEIDVALARPQRTIWLHAGSAIAIDAATVGTTALAVTRDDSREPLLGVTAPTPLVGAVTLRFEFSAPFATDAGLMAQASGGQTFIYSDFEPADARSAFPCFDEPRWRTPWTVTVRAPDGLTAIANMPETAATREDLWIVHQFAPTPPLPTYLVAVAAGAFTVVDVPGGAVPMRVIAPPRLAHVEHARALLAPLLDASVAWLGRPWPWPKVDLVVVPELAGAMENPGLVTIAAAIADGPSSAEDRARLALVIAHELAHGWFGGVVTPRSWRELWLNEGLATWMSEAVLRGLPASPRSVAESTVERLATWPRGKVARALRPATLRHPRETFDQLTYQLGATTIDSAARWLGDDAVREALRGYLDARPWGVVDSGALYAALAPIAPDLPVTEVMAGLVDTPGIAAIAAEPRCTTGRAWLALRQDAPRRPVAVCARWGGASAGRGCAVVDDVAAIELGAACPSWVMPDDGGVGAYRWQVPAPALAALTIAPLTSAERVSVVEAAVAATIDGHAGTDELVAALTAAVASGDHAAVADAAIWLRALDDALPPRRRTALATAVRAAADRGLAVVGRRGGPRDAAPLVRARAALRELTGTVGADRVTQRWAARTVTAWRRGTAVASDELDLALVIAAPRLRGAARAALIAATTSGAKPSASPEALGRALATVPGDDVIARLVDPAADVAVRVRVAALGAMLERPGRGAALAIALPRALADAARYLTPRPCAAPPPAPDRPSPPERDVELAAARCQAVLARVASAP